MSKLLLPLALFGPTASGKTALAIELAQRLDGVIINADSLQVYAACPTLTARPDAGEMAAADHRLYGFLPETEKMDVARWLTLAKAEAARVQAEGKLPIFCGGTGFYLKALEEGLSAIPPIATETLEAAEHRLDALGLKAFEQEVLTADPNLSVQFEVGDRQRLLRAWSVWQGTGQPLSHWHAQPKQGGVGRLRSFALLPDRTALYDRIDQRFAAMLNLGAEAEVAAVAARAQARGLDPYGLPLAQALGFKELLAVQDGQMSLPEAQERASQVSRNYAKRQLTWARNQMARNQSQGVIKLPYRSISKQQIKNLCDLIIAFMSQKA